MAEIPVEKKSSLAWLWIILGLILAALLLWWLLSGDEEDLASEAVVAEDNVVPGPAAGEEITTAEQTPLTAETVEQANQRALERLRNNPDATPRVFFAFDSAELTSGAQAVLDELIGTRTEAAEGITLVGFADRAGPRPYNRELSEQRAVQVWQYLAGLGIGADQIDVEADGETPPLVETGDGVREPLNRRVRVELADSE